MTVPSPCLPVSLLPSVRKARRRNQGPIPSPQPRWTRAIGNVPQGQSLPNLAQVCSTNCLRCQSIPSCDQLSIFLLLFRADANVCRALLYVVKHILTIDCAKKWCPAVSGTAHFPALSTQFVESAHHQLKSLISYVSIWFQVCPSFNLKFAPLAVPVPVPVPAPGPAFVSSSYLISRQGIGAFEA